VSGERGTLGHPRIAPADASVGPRRAITAGERYEGGDDPSEIEAALSIISIYRAVFSIRPAQQQRRDDVIATGAGMQTAIRSIRMESPWQGGFPAVESDRRANSRFYFFFPALLRAFAKRNETGSLSLSLAAPRASKFALVTNCARLRRPGERSIIRTNRDNLTMDKCRAGCSCRPSGADIAR